MSLGKYFFLYNGSVAKEANRGKGYFGHFACEAEGGGGDGDGGGGGGGAR